MLVTPEGETLASGYERVVHGGRGSYIECTHAQINWDTFAVPFNCGWRLHDPVWKDRVYYVEWRSRTSNVKLYDQKRLVDYADYKVGFYYLAPIDLAQECADKLVT